MPALPILGSVGSTDKIGILTLTAKFWVATEEEALEFLSARAPHKGVSFDEGGYEQDESGQFVLTCKYQGFLNDNLPNPDEATEFAFDGEQSEERIESHPKFDELKEKYLFDETEKMFTGEMANAAGDDGLIGPVTEEQQGKVDLMRGVDKWLVIGGEYTITYAAKVIPSGLFLGVGTKVSAPRGIGQFNLNLGKRGFLKLMPRVTKRGSAIQIQERYKLSGPKGVSTDIYGAGQLDPDSDGE